MSFIVCLYISLWASCPHIFIIVTLLRVAENKLDLKHIYNIFDWIKDNRDFINITILYNFKISMKPETADSRSGYKLYKKEYVMNR